MYPNPVNAGELLHISLDNYMPSARIRVSVYDIQGKLFSLNEFKGQTKLIISTNGLATGIYLVKVSTESNETNRKLLIK